MALSVAIGGGGFVSSIFNTIATTAMVPIAEVSAEAVDESDFTFTESEDGYVRCFESESDANQYIMNNWSPKKEVEIITNDNTGIPDSMDEG